MAEQEWLSVKQAAALLGVGRRAIHTYIALGKLHSYKTGVGSRTLLRKDELEAFKEPRPKQ